VLAVAWGRPIRICLQAKWGKALTRINSGTRDRSKRPLPGYEPAMVGVHRADMLAGTMLPSPRKPARRPSGFVESQVTDRHLTAPQASAWPMQRAFLTAMGLGPRVWTCLRAPARTLGARIDAPLPPVHPDERSVGLGKSPYRQAPPDPGTLGRCRRFCTTALAHARPQGMRNGWIPANRGPLPERQVWLDFPGCPSC